MTEKHPVAAFGLPPCQPAEVAEAAARLNRLGDEWGALRGELHDAAEAVREARAADARAIADAALDGRKVVDSTKREREARAKVEQLERRIEGVAIALDEAGNELADAVAASRAGWLAVLAEAEREAVERFTAALSEAEAALVALGPARQAVHWLDGFDSGEARVGRQQQFSGGRVNVDTTDVRRESAVDARVLFAVLATVADPPEPVQSRRHKVAVR
jgi:hypothetical protein